MKALPTSLFGRVWWMSALCVFAASLPLGGQGITPSPSPIPGGGYRIAGTVISKSDGHPLVRARVMVREENDRRKLVSMLTSTEGKFEFTGLPAGKYGLEAARQGFISAGYDQHDQFATAIVTGAGFDTETLVLSLEPAATIRGRILDEAGEPVRRAMVTSYFGDHSGGVDQIREFRGAQTDDLGVYEIARLMPGTYYLSVTAKPWYAIHPPSQPDASAPANPQPSGATTEVQAVPQFATPVVVDRSLDVAYPVTYYPDVTDQDSALPIPVRGGDHIQVDIHLNPVPALRLRFHVAEDPSQGYNIPQLEQSSFEGSAYLQTEVSSQVAPGVMEIAGIPAGRYNVHINGAGPAAVMNGIELTRDGEELDVSAAEVLSTVKISMQVPGEHSPPRIMVGLRAGRKMIAGWQPFDSKGEVQFEQVAPGRCEVVVLGSSRPYSISHLSAEGAAVAGHTATVKAGSTPSLALTLVGGGSDIRGVVKRDGKPFAGAMVVLVPKATELYTDLFRRDQSDLDGTFLLRAVIPGAYTVVAIEHGWDLNWSQPGVISAYLKHGEPVEVGNQSGRSLNLPAALDLQPK